MPGWWRWRDRGQEEVPGQAMAEVQAEIDRWDAVIRDRPPLEQVLTCAVAASLAVLDFTVMRPSPGARDYAAQSLALNPPGDGYSPALELAKLMPGPHGAPDRQALRLHALNQYLLLSMGSRDAAMLPLAGEAATLVGLVARRTPSYRAMVPVELLLAAEHLAEHGRMAECRSLVDQAIGLLERMGRLRGRTGLDREYRAVVPVVLNAARAARTELQRSA